MSKRMSDEPIASSAREKRKRDPTFSASEKLALIELVENHFNIVEVKKTDAVTMRQKTEEWRKIEAEFNATSSIHPRDWTVLKNCWENLKKRAKQELTQRNEHFMGTGGGPPKKKIEDPVIDHVITLIQPRVSGYINVYDSDSTNIDAGETIPHLTQEKEIATTETVDWAPYTPIMLRDPIDPRLKPPSPSFVDVELEVHEEQSSCSTALPDLTEQVQPVITPRGQHPAVPTSRGRPTPSTRRRRPTLTRDRAPETLSSHRIATLALANSQAEEEHDIRIRILRLQEEQEKEKLTQETLKRKQEEIKLEMLLMELRILKE